MGILCPLQNMKVISCGKFFKNGKILKKNMKFQKILATDQKKKKKKILKFDLNRRNVR